MSLTLNLRRFWPVQNITDDATNGTDFTNETVVDTVSEGIVLS